jgi:hypothetical protein
MHVYRFELQVPILGAAMGWRRVRLLRIGIYGYVITVNTTV